MGFKTADVTGKTWREGGSGKGRVKMDGAIATRPELAERPSLIV